MNEAAYHTGVAIGFYGPIILLAAFLIFSWIVIYRNVIAVRGGWVATLGRIAITTLMTTGLLGVVLIVIILMGA